MKRLLLTLGFVCFVMPVLLSADTPEPPLADQPSSQASLQPPTFIAPTSAQAWYRRLCNCPRYGQTQMVSVPVHVDGWLWDHVEIHRVPAVMRIDEQLVADPPKPPSPPAPVTLESLKARRAQMTELMRQYGEVAKQYAADVAELKRQAKELNIELDIKPVDLGIGKQGPRGYSAYEVAKQNGFKGTQAEWLASLKGERGPQGPPGPPGPGPGPVPPPVVDSFTKAVQDAWADPSTDRTYLNSLKTLWKALGEYAAADATTGTLFSRYDAGFKAAALTGKMPAVMDVINKPLFDLMGGTSKPFTDDLRDKVKAQISKTLDVLGTLKR